MDLVPHAFTHKQTTDFMLVLQANHPAKTSFLILIVKINFEYSRIL